jgi:hypothetical protein
MMGCDFRHAQLHDVAFRGLTLEHVLLPENDEHIVIKDAAKSLDSLTARLASDGDMLSKRMIAFLNIDRKWVAPFKAKRAINVTDMRETIGQEAVDRLRRMLTDLQIGR